jgi:hypothetical protein
MASIGMNPVLNKVMAGDNFVSNIRTVILIGFVAHNDTYCPTGAEQGRTSWHTGIPKAEVHGCLKHRKPLTIRLQEDFFLTLNRDAIQGDGVIWVVVITNDVVWHNYSYHK